MMKKIMLIGMVAIIFVACDNNGDPDPEKRTDCTIKATVINMTGLDGCGAVFQLEDGSIIEPYMECSLPGDSHAPGALSGFDFADGKKVLIEYVPAMVVTICQAGTAATFTCLTELPLSSVEE